MHRAVVVQGVLQHQVCIAREYAAAAVLPGALGHGGGSERKAVGPPSVVVSEAACRLQRAREAERGFFRTHVTRKSVF